MQPLTHTKRKAQKSTEKHHEKSENVSTTIGFARAHLHVDDTILVKLQNGDEFYGEIVNVSRKFFFVIVMVSYIFSI